MFRQSTKPTYKNMFSVPLSGLNASKTALDTIGQNIANASTEGYHRQKIDFVSRAPVQRNNHFIGQGVDVSRIERVYDNLSEEAYTNNITNREEVATRLRMSQRLESLMLSGQGSVMDRLESFFNELERLTSYPDDAAARSVVIRSADALASELNDFESRLNGVINDVELEISRVLDDVNAIIEDIIALNEEINFAESGNIPANDLLDQRDILVNELAKYVDVEPEVQINTGGEKPVELSGYRITHGFLSFTEHAITLESHLENDGSISIRRSNSTDSITQSGGRLGGLLAIRNGLLADYKTDYREFTQGLVTAIDTAHASGVGLDGAHVSLNGQRSFGSITDPLSDTESFVTVEAGSLFISVVDPNGDRTLNEVTIDPDTQSLTDVAAAISGVDHLQAVINTTNGRISLLAEPGYKFEFTGHLASSLDTSLITGTTSPAVTGQYVGNVNDEFEFEFLETGTIGVSSSLKVEIRNGVGDVVDVIDVGQDYSPGTDIFLGDGISVSFSTGDANTGDLFSAHLVAKSDTTGFLTASGLNTLFVGDSTGQLAVSSRLHDDADALATSQNGDPLDTTNTQRILAVRDAPTFSNGETIEDFYLNLSSSIGADIKSLDGELSNLEFLGTSLKADIARVSGVDPNEEMILLLQYQRAYEANTRVIVTLDNALQELFNIIR